MSRTIQLMQSPVVKKVKSNYFIVRPKVDQRDGLLKSAALSNFCHSHTLMFFKI